MSVEGTTEEDVVIEVDQQDGAGDGAAVQVADADAAGGVSTISDGDAAAANDDAEELVITLGDDTPGGDEDDENPDGLTGKQREAFYKLRHAKRQAKREAAALKEEVGRLKTASAPPPVVVGERPKLEDFDFDADRYATELERYLERKAAADREAAAKADTERKAQEQWQARLNSYGHAKTSLKVADFDEAEEVARDTFSVVQQSVILKGVRSPEKAAQLIYALGKNPKKAKELAAITDPVEFAVAIGEVATMLKTQTRKTAPIPERVVRGSSPGAGALDNELARLEAEADRTGDRTKVAAYRRAQMLKQRAA